DKRIVLDAIRASLQAGETLSRVLVDREEDRYERGLSGKPQEVGMQQENGAVRAFDANGEEVDLSTIDMHNVDSDEDIEDGGAVDENGVMVGDPADDARKVGTLPGASQPGASLPGASLPNQVTVTLPRPLLERAFAKAGRELPGTMGTAEIVEVLELALN
ncbi:MAG: chromosome partitioning protein ParB, partial [Acidithiobacillus sp.]|nr:chromosome partitioning protein ParB [Acidithiobacillus sp.]